MGRTVTRIPRSEEDWIYTASGRKFWPLDPRAEEISAHDIAHALARICRFNGHCASFYSVAQHSVLVARQAMQQCHGRGGSADQVRMIGLWGLLHDAAGAYLCDLVRPMKHSRQIGRVYAGFELGLQMTICEKFGLPAAMPNDVRWADEILLATEFRDLMVHCEMPPALRLITPLDGVIEPMPSQVAQREFLAELERLTAGRPQ